MTATLGLLFCTCSPKHAAVWQHASRNLLRHVHAVDYVVAVPDAAIPLFRSITPLEFEVAPDSRYLGISSLPLLAALSAHDPMRVPFYLQQFVKLEAMAKANVDAALLWDGDTVPLRPFAFVDERSRLVFHLSDDRNPTHVEAVRRILGLDPLVGRSFSAQCLPVRPEWVRECLAAIEERHGKPWPEAIAAGIDPGVAAGFSEYELLGTFFSHRHLEGMAFSASPWLLTGTSTIGGIERLDDPAEAHLAEQYDYVAFELWDVPPGAFRRMLRGAKRLARVTGRTIRRGDNRAG
ncbi:MAG: hypothetical protein KIT43_07125 [Bauldia sp.]|nr:hypothetical protein [Bauldia sp.]